MEPEVYGRLKEVFLAAEALPEPEREPYLTATCSDDPSLLAEARALLAFTGSGFLAPPPAAAVPDPPSLAGQSIAHFRVIERLGAGGMGVVYRAADTRLPRTVALKLLQPELIPSAAARERLLREARAVAALDHPNVCAIFEVGETAEGRTFLAMACYDGEDLGERLRRGPLPAAEAVDVAAQIAAGLEHAHARGIVHRDLKPANVMITVEGRVRVLDFGLARLVDDARLTGTGASFGTPAYMSPEQIRSAAVDARSDVWSLGVLLHEMLTGEAAFPGEGVQAVFYSILHQQPRPLATRARDLPDGLAAVLDRLLSKSTADRYQDMGAVRRALASVGTPEAPKRPWRARLLAQRHGGALAGSARWIAMAGVLAALAATGLAWRAPEPFSLAGRSTASDEARRLYLKGMHLYDRSEFARARDLFARAVAADPGFALAHAALSSATSYLGFFGTLPAAEAYPQADAAAVQAVRLDADLAAGHVALALARFFGHLDYAGAEAALRRATELDPRSFDAHYVAGVLSVNRGRLDRGMRELGRALELDPVSGKTYMMLARGHLYRRDYEQAIALVRQGQELMFAPMGARLLTTAYWQLGRRHEAAEAAAEVSAHHGQFFGHLASGRRREATALVDRWSAARLAGERQPDSVTIGYFYVLLGERDQALAWAERAYAEPAGRLGFTQYYQLPEWDLVRADPRFEALLEGVDPEARSSR
jgi:tetratricopeptide (TPR) repeat protein